MYHFRFLPTEHKYSNFSTYSPKLIIFYFVLFQSSYSNSCDVLTHHGFYLYFPIYWWFFSVFLALCILSLRKIYLLLTNMFIALLVDYTSVAYKHNFYMHWEKKLLWFPFFDNSISVVVWDQTHHISEGCLFSGLEKYLYFVKT
jgi:hypothetical protein